MGPAASAGDRLKKKSSLLGERGLEGQIGRVGELTGTASGSVNFSLPVTPRPARPGEASWLPLGN